MRETDNKRKKDSVLKRIVRNPWTTLAPGIILFMAGMSDADGYQSRMNSKAYDVFPDVVSEERLTQAQNEITLFNKNVNEQVSQQIRQGNLVINLSEIADQQRINEDLNLLAEQEVRIQERENFRENLPPPIKDKRLLIDLGLVVGGFGLIAFNAWRRIFSRRRKHTVVRKLRPTE